MKIIITGGAGFIGGNFVHYMVNKYPNDQFICLDLLTYAGNLATIEQVMDKDNFKFIKGDIADRKFVYEIFREGWRGEKETTCLSSGASPVAGSRFRSCMGKRSCDGECRRVSVFVPYHRRPVDA